MGTDFSLHGRHGHESIRMPIPRCRAIVVGNRHCGCGGLIDGVKWVLPGGCMDRPSLDLLLLHLSVEAGRLVDLMLGLVHILIILVNTLLQRDKLANCAINLLIAG